MLAQHLSPWDDGLNWLFEQGPDCSHLYSEECLGAKSYWLNHGEFPEERDCQAYSTGWGWKQGKYAVWTFVLASSFFKGGLELSTCTFFWCFHGKLCTEVLSTVNLFFRWEDSPSCLSFQVKVSPGGKLEVLPVEEVLSLSIQSAQHYAEPAQNVKPPHLHMYVLTLTIRLNHFPLTG